MKLSSIYIPDVINEERLYFFQIPRFGAFFAIKFKLKTFFTKQCFMNILIYLKNNYIPELGNVLKYLIFRTFKRIKKK